MVMKNIKFRAMGSHIQATIDSDSPRAAAELGKVPAWFEEWEQFLSRFRPDSELNRLNRAGGSPVQVSQILWDVMQTARMAAEQSRGLITPTVLDALEEAGYDRTFDDLSQSLRMRLPQAGSTPAPIDEIFLDESSRTIYLPKGMRLDFGGVAKGWAGHQTMLRLEAIGATLVDAGGDLSVSGLLEGDTPWEISIVDPFAPRQQEEPFAIFGAGRCGVATSGRDYRRWLKNGAWKHHIIDPRTGLPAETDVVSATVIASNVMDAEIAAKEALILGGGPGLAHIAGLPGYAAILVLQNGQVLIDPRLDGIVELVRQPDPARQQLGEAQLTH
jgi:FAD:protein FMN transferase